MNWNTIYWVIYRIFINILIFSIGFYTAKRIYNKEENTTGHDERCYHCNAMISKKEEIGFIRIFHAGETTVIVHWKCLSQLIKYTSDRMKE